MRVQLAVLSALLFVTALVAGVNGACSGSHDVSTQVNLASFVYVEKWIINSQWNVTIVEGTELAVSFEGSDSGSVSTSLSADNKTLSATFSIAAGGSTPSDGITATPRPRRQIVSSASSNGIVGLNSIITLITGLLFARSTNKQGLIMLAVAFLMLSVTMETTMAQTAECPSATIKATIPSGLVRWICLNADTPADCQCGPGFSGANCDPDVQVPSVAPTVEAPVAAPVTTPVATPVAVPVAAPVATPVAVPVAAPVTTPVAVPVAAPVATPVAVPVATPVAVPVAAPVATPVATPVAIPVAAPVEAPVTVPVATPVAAPVAAPVDVPVAVADPPVEAPVTVPVAVPEAAPVAA